MDLKISYGASMMGITFEPRSGPWRIHRIFTTQDGNWGRYDRKYDLPYGGWADVYNAPPFAERGGSTHFFCRLEGSTGKIVYSRMDGDREIQVIGDTGEKGSGWSNLFLGGSGFFPGPQHGVWRAQPAEGGDMVIGVGLPENLHVSTFCVWVRDDVAPPSKPDLNLSIHDFRLRITMINGTPIPEIFPFP